MPDLQPQDVLFYWFGELTDGWTTAARDKLWFAANPEDDREMRQQFSPLIQRALNGDLEEWRQTPHELMAYIILLDQMRRATKRGSAAAFDGDPQALAACKLGLSSDMDKHMPPVYCRFFYLPLEHSENLADQQQCADLFIAAQQRFPQHQALFADSHKYAVIHLQIIKQFARFPHRNAVLGRASTAAEKEYLQQNPGAHFGQKSDN